MRHFINRIFKSSTSDRQLLLQLEHIVGFTPVYIAYYRLALIHRSKPEDVTDSNERLEFLGDAILGAIVAEYLFKKYPYESEGYLTELRSRIVRRETLNNVALRMGLNKLVQYNHHDRGLSRSHIFGNALEALIGAVYLDKGFAKTRTFILNQIIKAYIDLDVLEATDTNYKNQLLSWAQRNGKNLTFETLDEQTEGTRKLFTVGVMLDGVLVVSGTGFNKKDAGQVAAKNAIDHLGV